MPIQSEACARRSRRSDSDRTSRRLLSPYEAFSARTPVKKILGFGSTLLMTAHRTNTAQITPGLTWLFAVADGLIVANLYYAQPLVGVIGPALNLPREAITLVVTLTQIGYGVGLLLLVPLGDLLENRRLIVVLLFGTTVGLIGTGLAPNALTFLLAALFTGICASCAQILVPFAASLAPPAHRGRVVGNIMGGLLTGILLARPLASLITDVLGWRAVYLLSAAASAALSVLLWRGLPERHPNSRIRYVPFLISLWHLLRDTLALRRRAAYHAAMFGAFSLFWSAIALELSAPPINYTQRGIALFALIGAAGALVAPLAGRWADRGWTRPATATALLLGVIAFGICAIGGRAHSVPILLAGGGLLDLSTSMNLVLGQRTIFALGDAERSRLNALYIALFFMGGGVGSALAGVAWAHGGWLRVCEIGGGSILLAFVYFTTEFLVRVPNNAEI